MVHWREFKGVFRCKNWAWLLWVGVGWMARGVNGILERDVEVNGNDLKLLIFLAVLAHSVRGFFQGYQVNILRNSTSWL